VLLLAGALETVLMAVTLHGENYLEFPDNANNHFPNTFSFFPFPAMTLFIKVLCTKRRHSADGKRRNS
jgi:hypothetical protein